MRRTTLAFLLLLPSTPACFGPCTTLGWNNPTRPDEWSEVLDRPGLPNLHRQSAVLYRGAQPTAEGWKELEALGVKSVLSLRGFHDDHPPEGCALRFEHIESHTLHPEDEDVVRFLRFVADPAHQPVFVHCAHGADRTGTMCAVARIVFDGWSREDALREMLQGGYEFHAWNRQLVRYVQRTDFARLADEAGVVLPKGATIAPPILDDD